MSLRLVVVRAPAQSTPLALAMLEDVVDLVEQMSEVQAALAVPADGPPELRATAWPSMPVFTLPATAALSILDAAHDHGADEAAVVVADVPDLPALLLGKLHSALATVDVAVCPAEDGGLIAVACRLPVTPWLRECDPDLDDPATLPLLRRTAPARGLVVGPGWHRITTTADLDRLDPSLEGWEATRVLLGR